jgi:hypothetical protein
MALARDMGVSKGNLLEAISTLWCSPFPGMGGRQPPPVKPINLHEKIAGKEILLDLGGDDADGNPVLGVSPGITVLDKQFPPLNKGQQPGVKIIELFRGHGTVLFPQGDMVGPRGLIYGEFVLGGTPGVGPGATTTGPKWAMRPSFLAGNDLLIQGRSGEFQCKAFTFLMACVSMFYGDI